MPRFAVAVFPGSNCEEDVLYALTEIMGQAGELVWHKEKSLRGFDAVILPGGFAHGDYLRPGAIARFSPIMDGVKQIAEAGKAVIGICNGFQMLQEAGMLPGAMLRNRSLSYICRYVYLRAESRDSPLTCSLDRDEILRIPIGHADGNFFAEPGELERLEKTSAIVFRYCDARGNSTDDANPNGASHHIAGVQNERGNVIGLMPHPDRCYEPSLGTDHGVRLFASLVEWTKRHA